MIKLFFIFVVLPFTPLLTQAQTFDSIINPYFIVSQEFQHEYVVEDSVMYTVEMIQEDLHFFESNWPQYVEVFAIGTSEFGLPITACKIQKDTTQKPAILMVGNIHAREDFSSKMVMKFTNVFLLALDGKSQLYPNASNLLDSVNIFIVPVANPDGLKIAHEDFTGIADSVRFWMDSIYSVESLKEWKANGKGVDLNCSFDDGNWNIKKGGSFQECMASEGYKGAYPAEPLETQSLQNFVQTIRPITTLSFHTKGNVLFWADVKTHAWFEGMDTKMAEDVEAQTMFRAAAIAKYGSEYGCGLENYVRSKLGSIGVCIELATGKGGRVQHPDNEFNDEVWLVAWKIPYLYLSNTVLYHERLKQLQAAFYQH